MSINSSTRVVPKMMTNAIKCLFEMSSCKIKSTIKRRKKQHRSFRRNPNRKATISKEKTRRVITQKNSELRPTNLLHTDAETASKTSLIRVINTDKSSFLYRSREHVFGFIFPSHERNSLNELFKLFALLLTMTF